MPNRVLAPASERKLLFARGRRAADSGCESWCGDSGDASERGVVRRRRALSWVRKSELREGWRGEAGEGGEGWSGGCARRGIGRRRGGCVSWVVLWEGVIVVWLVICSSIGVSVDSTPS